MRLGRLSMCGRGDVVMRGGVGRAGTSSTTSSMMVRTVRTFETPLGNGERYTGTDDHMRKG